jgi:ribosome-associated protein
VESGRVTPEDNDLSLELSAANAAQRDAIQMTAPVEATSEQILAAVLASLEDDKAEDIVQISLRGKTEMADFMVIASGRSTRQVAAISEKLTERLKQDLGVFCKVEGAEVGDWVLIDAGDVIVHVFRPEVREFYQLEKMWQPSGATAKAN